jgi:hypothetical protein
MASSSGCNSLGAELNQIAAPDPRAAPNTAATWPWGSERSIVSSEAAFEKHAKVLD